MTFSFPRFSSTLCPRKEPERGCLARATNTTAPQGSTPILSLPPEVRAQIFKYLLNDVDLTFRFDTEFAQSTCWARWPEFHKNLSFMKACRLFEAEALALVQIEAINIEVDGPSTLTTPRLPRLKSIARLSGSIPQPIALRLDSVRWHVQELSIDAGHSLHHLLKADILESFPKLRIIRIKQTLWPRIFTYRDRAKLNKASTRKLLVQGSLGERSPYDPRSSYIPTSMYVCRDKKVKLQSLLQHPKFSPFHPIYIEVQQKALSRGPEEWESDGAPSYPRRSEISAVRFTYEWPSKRTSNMEVSMFNQPMLTAVKSEWVETVSLIENKEDKATTTNEVISLMIGD